MILFLKIDRMEIYFYELFIFLNDDVDLADDAIVDRRQIKENAVAVDRIWNVVIDDHAEDLNVSHFLFNQTVLSHQIFLER